MRRPGISRRGRESGSSRSAPSRPSCCRARAAGRPRRGLARTFASSCAFMAACLCLAGAVFFYVERQEAALLALGADRAQHPGALVLMGDTAARSFASDFAPALLVAKKDVPKIYRK